jgi:hypothetical protein
VFKQYSPTKRFKCLSCVSDSVIAYIGLRPFARIRVEAQVYDTMVQSATRELLLASGLGTEGISGGVCGLELGRMSSSDALIVNKAECE